MDFTAGVSKPGCSAAAPHTVCYAHSAWGSRGSERLWDMPNINITQQIHVRMEVPSECCIFLLHHAEMQKSKILYVEYE